MNKVLKDLSFAITYIDDLIIYNKTTEDHLDHLKQAFHKLECKTVHETKQMSFLC